MSGTLRVKREHLLIGVAVIVVVFGALAAIDAPNRTYTGFQMDGMHRVRTVEAGSPAAHAGVQKGDILKSVNGLLVTDTKSALRLGTALPSGTYGFERGGQTVQLEILPAPLPAKRLYLALAATLIGLVFLGFPLWAYFTASGRPATLLAVFGLTFGATILGTPNFQSPAISLIVFATMWVLAFLGTAVLLHFLLSFPSPVRLLARPWGTTILYGPVVALVVIGAIIITSQREAAQALGGSMLLFFGIYFLAAITVLLWRYVTASSGSRTAHGLRLMLISVIVVLALLPAYPVVTNIWLSISALPNWLPWEYFALAVVTLIPIGFSVAVVRSARSKGRADRVTT